MIYHSPPAVRLVLERDGQRMHVGQDSQFTWGEVTLLGGHPELPIKANLLNVLIATKRTFPGARIVETNDVTAIAIRQREMAAALGTPDCPQGSDVPDAAWPRLPYSVRPSRPPKRRGTTKHARQAEPLLPLRK